MKDKNITKILKFNIGRDELWIYSVLNELAEDEVLKYYLLTVVDNVPEIEPIDRPMDILKNMKDDRPVEIGVSENSIEYIRFMAIKNVAENNILSKIQNTQKR